MALALLLAAIMPARADDYGTPDEARAMVERALVYLKSRGRAAALAEFSNPKGQFVDRDLYVIAYDAGSGVRLSHPYNNQLVGKSVAEAHDIDGKPYGKAILEVARHQGVGWVDYTFTDPLTKKLSGKRLYVKRVDDVILGCGFYSRR